MTLGANEFAGFTFDGIANMAQSVAIELSEVPSGNPILAVLDNANGTWVNLSSQRVSTKGTYTLNFTPTTNQFQVRILGQGRVLVRKICTTVPVLSQENVLVDICPGDNDRYRFGFNGQEKVNEWAGVGNYIDMGGRAQDTRTGRLGYSVDPLIIKYPWQSPYTFAGNSPIMFIDKNGDNAWVKITKEGGKNHVHIATTVYVTGAVNKSNIESYKNQTLKDFRAQSTTYNGANWDITYSINYVYQMAFSPSQLKPGENLMAVNNIAANGRAHVSVSLKRKQFKIRQNVLILNINEEVKIHRDTNCQGS